MDSDTAAPKLAAPEWQWLMPTATCLESKAKAMAAISLQLFKI